MTETTLQNIFNQLNITDAFALKESFPGDTMMETCYQTRHHPAVYLAKSFRHPITLLSAMFDSGSLLSGPRCLDYFIPGIQYHNSSWDFFVPGCKESVADMLNVLGICGVEWMPEGDRIVNRLMEYGSVTVEAHIMYALESWTLGINQDMAQDLLGQNLFAIMQEFRITKRDESDLAFTISTNVKDNIKPFQISREQQPETAIDTESERMIHGSINSISGIETVRLIIDCNGPGKGSLDFIRDFYASHIQCFIGGWCASHLYYYHTTAKQTKIWQQPYMSPDIDKAIVEDGITGFKFEHTKNQSPILRSLQDSQSVFIDYGDIFQPFIRHSNKDLLENWLAERRQNIRDLIWMDFNDQMYIMNNSTKSHARRMKSFATMGFNLPLCRLRRLSDIISLNTPATDDARSADFLSSVRHTLRGKKWELAEVARSGSIHFQDLYDGSPWVWVM